MFPPIMKSTLRSGDLAKGVRIDAYNVDAPHAVAAALTNMFLEFDDSFEKVLVLCIGTDRSTGDSLGPLVGSLLREQYLPYLDVVGDLDHPTHAINLAETIKHKLAKNKDPVIAVDACLGKQSSVGKINVGRGALRPGAGVDKKLPPVGDFYITGVVNVGGGMEYLILQNTRLSVIMKLAKVISGGIAEFAQTSLMNRKGLLL